MIRLFWLRLKWRLWNAIIDARIPVPAIRWVTVGVNVRALELTDAECHELDVAEGKA